MTHSLQLIGVGRVALPLAVQDITSIACGDLYAFVRKLSVKANKKQTKGDAAKILLRHQKALEALLVHTDFLPAQSSLIFADHQALEDFLKSEIDLITDEMGRYADQRQYQIVISWSLDRALKRLPHTEHGKPYLAALAAGRDKRVVGEAIRDGMAAWRATNIERIHRQIKAVTTDMLILPVEDDDALFNGVALVGKTAVDLLEEVLESIDAQFVDELRIQMIGPLPACSFSSIGAANHDSAADQMAMKALGVGGGQSASALRTAWLGKAKQSHPDKTHGDSVAMSGLNDAYHHLKSRLRKGKVPVPTIGPTLVIHRDPLLTGARS